MCVGAKRGIAAPTLPQGASRNLPKGSGEPVNTSTANGRQVTPRPFRTPDHLSWVLLSSIPAPPCFP